jgi:branched-subunit amino acid permease
MLLLTAITVAVFGAGYWSAWMRISQLGGTALPTTTKLIMGALGLLFAAIAASLITSPGLGVIIAEFFVLCFGQTLGYILSGQRKKV